MGQLSAIYLLSVLLMLLMMEKQKLEQALNQAIVDGRSDQIQLIADDLDWLITKDNQFSPENFNMLTSVLKQTEFLGLEESHCLLYVFFTNWDLLSEEQKNELLLIFEITYPLFKDWMSWFTISEIIGEFYKNSQAFEVLRRLKSIELEHPRSFIAHGLEHIATSSDKELAMKAYSELLDMKNDSSERVQYEVQLSIQKLRNKGHL